MTKLLSLLLLLALLAGVGALLYPTASDQYTRFRNARDLSAYARTAECLDPAAYREALERARAYNAGLTGGVPADAFDGDAAGGSDDYLSQLDINGDGIMGVIEIPKIGVRLPIYHTTGADGLERGVGHMEGTGLPVGGEGVHCAMAGHRALPAARLFTDLDRLETGDLFYIDVLNETLVYQVDRVLTVLPHEMEYLAPEPGRDLVTLVTCTPYGVNTHRLLVRGERVRPADVAARLARTDTAQPLPAWEGAVIVAVPTALVFWLLMAVATPRRRRRPANGGGRINRET